MMCRLLRTIGLAVDTPNPLSTSTSTTPSLLDLPAELLDTIVVLVHWRYPRQYLGAVHRAFLLASRRLVFRNLKVKHYAQLERLSLLLQGSRELAQTVRSFSLKPWGGDRAGRLPMTEVIRDLLATLTRLTRLEVPSSGPLVDAVLTHDAKGVFLPRLETLILSSASSASSQTSSPCDPRRFLNLGNYPRLDALSITWCIAGFSEDEADQDEAGAEAYTPLQWELPGTGSWSIFLDGPLSNDPAVPDLLSFFPSIDTLVLQNHSNKGQSVRPFLEALEDPSTLTTLELPNGGCRFDDLHAFLPACANLVSLEIGRTSYTPALLPVLSSLTKLEDLTFGLYTPVSSISLANSLAAASAFPVLDILRLDVVETETDAGFRSDGHGWSSDFTLEGVQTLLVAAGQRDLQVCGEAARIARREMRRAASGR